MEEKHLQMSESFFLTAILAIVGGFLDSYEDAASFKETQRIRMFLELREL